MIAEQVFHQLLNLGECWEVRGVDYEAEANHFVIVIGETEKLWPTQVRPQSKYRHRTVTCYDHPDTRSWRHLDVFSKKSEILCAVPRGRVYRVPVPGEGEGKHFTREFEAFTLTLTTSNDAPSWIWGPRNTEPEVVICKRRGVPAAVGGPAVPGIRVPRTAAQHPILPRDRALRVGT